MKQGASERVLPIYEAGAWRAPYVIAGFDEVMTADTWWPEHSHPTHELTWNVRGASTVIVGAREWTLTPSFGLWMPAGIRHAAWTPSGTWYRAAHFNVDGVEPLATEPVVVEIKPLLKLLLQRLDDRALAPSSRALTEALVLDLLEPSSRGILVKIPQAAFLHPLVRSIQDDPADCGTLEGWAAQLGVNPRTITRALQAETGFGFARWVALVRMRRAVHLLAEGMDVENIAAETGYASASAFGAAFRRVTGSTPGSFRESGSE